MPRWPRSMWAAVRCIALYGGPDFVKNSRNWATTAAPDRLHVQDLRARRRTEGRLQPLSRFNGNTFTPPGEPKPVRNEFSYQYGSAVDLIKATADSINTAFVDLTSQMDNGPRKIMKMAEAAGAPKGAGWDNNPRIPLGTAEVSPLDQASAYATFANDGVTVPSHVVRRFGTERKGPLPGAAREEARGRVTTSPTTSPTRCPTWWSRAPAAPCRPSTDRWQARPAPRTGRTTTVRAMSSRPGSWHTPGRSPPR